MCQLQTIFSKVTQVDEGDQPIQAVVFDVVGTLVDLNGNKIPGVEPFMVWLCERKDKLQADVMLCSSDPQLAKELLEKAKVHDAIRSLPVSRHDATYIRLANANKAFLAVNDEPMLPLMFDARGVLDPTDAKAQTFLKKEIYRQCTLS